MGKSKARRPTDEQVMIISKNGLMVKDWLVLWESADKLCMVHRSSGKSRKISKKETPEAATSRESK